MAKRPSGWVNLQDYLDLNQEQGAEMGQRLAADVAEDAAHAGGRISSAATEFGYRVGHGTLARPDDAAFVHGTNANLYTPEQAGQMAMGGYSGPTSLGDINPELYGQVEDAVARVKNAQDPNMRGTELAKAYAGQSASGAAGSALDSFLTGQAGAASLSGVDDSYGGLMESLGIAEKRAGEQAQVGIDLSRENAAEWARLKPVLEGVDKTKDGTPEKGPNPSGFNNLREFMDTGSGAQLHEVAMYASPADWITRGLGELGYDGENASQLFVKGVTSGAADGNKNRDWNVGNLRSAARLVQDQYGPEALEAWFNALTPEAWDMYLSKGNAGAQARHMRKWLSENGYNRIR